MFNKKYLFFLSIAVLLLYYAPAASLAGERIVAPVLQSELIGYFPHDPEAFTQGLLYHNGFFYESTGKHGRSSVRKVEIQSGAVRTENRISSKLFGEGLCLWQDSLYQLTWKSGKCYVYDSSTLMRKGVFRYKGQGWGLTTDGQVLFQSDGSSSITIRNPKDFKRIGRLQVRDGAEKVHRINELEYVNGIIYCNIWQEDSIAAVDSLSGKVLFRIDISGLRPLVGSEAEAANGIAWDSAGQRFFVTGKYWDKVFQIRLPEKIRTAANSYLHE